MTFLLLANPRTGSTMLRLALSRHPDVLMHVLYFGGDHADWVNFQRTTGKVLGTQVYRSVDDKWIADNGQLSPGEFWSMLNHQHDRVISLRRENLLRQFLSREVAGDVPGKRESLHPREMEPEPVVLRPAALLAFVESTLGARRTVDDVFEGRHVVWYERLVSRWEETLAGIQEYLGLLPKRIPQETYRQETRPLRDAIGNYDEIASFLVHFGWLDWLKEE